MLHIKPVPPAPSVSRQRPHFTTKAKTSGLAGQVSNVASHLGNTITGWLLSELNAKASHDKLDSHPDKNYVLKKTSDGTMDGEYAQPRAVFYTPDKEASVSSNVHLSIPSPKKRAPSPHPGVIPIEEEDEEGDDLPPLVKLPRRPPPARTSPPPIIREPPSINKKPPPRFTEPLPIAPKQLLASVEVFPHKPKSQRKPTPPPSLIHPPTPKDELPPAPLSDLPIPNITITEKTFSPDSKTPTHSDAPQKRPIFQRVISSPSVENSGFTFEFPPVAPPKENLAQRLRIQRRPPKPTQSRRSAAEECMQNFMDEYVEMRRGVLKKMKREQRFPVAGQLMNAMSDVGSVYAFSLKVHEIDV
jgi:hypothetical protein